MKPHPDTLCSQVIAFLVQVATIPQLGSKNRTGSVLSEQKSLRRSSDLPPGTRVHGHDQGENNLSVDPPVVCFDERSLSNIEDCH